MTETRLKKRLEVVDQHLNPIVCTTFHHHVPDPFSPQTSSERWSLSQLEEKHETSEVVFQEAEREKQRTFGKEERIADAEQCLGQIVLSQPKEEEDKPIPLHKKKVVLVVGAGDATGGAVAKKFAKEGFVACVLRRNKEKLLPLQEDIIQAGGEAYAFGVDARKEEEIAAVVKHIEEKIGEISVAVHNIGANVKFGILETSSRVYFKVWEMACFSGFLTGREVAKYMVPRGNGTIIFTGATASIRGGVGFAAFAGAKFALRALAQSMARELGPKGVHVAHVVIDAAINTAWTLQNLKDASSLIQQDAIVEPDDVATFYWHIHQQPRSAWSHEVDLRPWKEHW